jgi:hypothetical protein
MHKFIICIVLALLLSCSSDEPRSSAPKEAKPPTPQAPKKAPAYAPDKKPVEDYSIEISPGRAKRDTSLTLLFEGFQPEKAKINWLVNGREVSTLSDYTFNINDEGATKGDTIQAKALIGEVEEFSNEVKVVNSLPSLSSIKIMPEVFKPGDKISVEAEATDPDNDLVTLFYEWKLNGLPAGLDTRMEGTLKRGDEFSVLVTPHDGEKYGKALLLQREVSNMPPEFQQNEKYDFRFEGQTYTFQARATDPDEDDITFALKSGPKDMTVDSETGYVKWVVPADFSGDQTFVLTASDGHGGEAIQSFELSIAFKSEEEGKKPESGEAEEEEETE